MRHEMNAHYDKDLGAPVEDAAQEAIDAVASTYAYDPGIDVEDHLRAQLSSRGIAAVDEAWAAQTAREIRSGHPVAVGRHDGSVEGPPGPGVVC